MDEGQIGRINLIETGYIHDMHSHTERTPWRVTVPQELLFGGGAHPYYCLRWFGFRPMFITSAVLGLVGIVFMALVARRQSLPDHSALAP